MTRASCWLTAAVLAVACGRSSAVFLGRDAFESTPAPAPEVAVDAGPPQPQPPAPAGTGAPPPPVTVACEPGFADCDGLRDNGCEADLSADPLHCGDCGVACSHDDCACEQGALVVRCPDGRADCDLDPGNGCEVELATDTANCGACDHVCNARAAAAAIDGVECVSGQCVLICAPSTLAPRGDCDGDPDNGCEALLWADSNNCGACGTTCTFCSDGVCL